MKTQLLLILFFTPLFLIGQKGQIVLPTQPLFFSISSQKRNLVSASDVTAWRLMFTPEIGLGYRRSINEKLGVTVGVGYSFMYYSTLHRLKLRDVATAIKSNISIPHEDRKGELRTLAHTHHTIAWTAGFDRFLLKDRSLSTGISSNLYFYRVVNTKLDPRTSKPGFIFRIPVETELDEDIINYFRPFQRDFFLAMDLCVNYYNRDSVLRIGAKFYLTTLDKEMMQHPIGLITSLVYSFPVSK